LWILGLAAAVLAAALLTVNVYSTEYALAYTGLLLLVTAIGLLTNVWGGLVASGAAVFAIFLLNQYLGVFPRENLLLNVAGEMVIFLFVGPLAGIVSGVVGRTHEQVGYWMTLAEERATHDPQLGTLRPDWARARLDEEILRAARHNRPLALALVRVELKPGGNANNRRVAMLQALIRVARSATTPPVVVAHGGSDRMMLILPEHTPQQAQEFIDALKTRLTDEKYFPGGGAAGGRTLGEPIGGAGEIRAAVAGLGPDVDSGEALFEKARSALDAA
jgi:GGDEF domain-containing protein